MVEGKFKSGRFRKIFVKTSGGRTAVHYKKRKPSKAKCAGCGAVLPGVPRERLHKMKKISKTKKRPERPYGGFLCSKCARKKIITEAREHA